MPRFEDLREMLAKIASIDADEIAPESQFFDDLGIETGQINEFLSALEKRYGINIPESDYGKIGSLGQLVKYLTSRTN